MPIFGISRRSKAQQLSARQGQPEVREMQTINIEGRRYYSDTEAAYMLPKDMQDVPRLDFQHYLLRQVMRGIYIAPVSDAASAVLDVGCGTGRWGTEMARAFPGAQVIGIDLEEVSGTGMEKPANYLFKQGNALGTFPFAENSFDFVHMRLMLMSIPAFKWSDVLNEIVRVARPGAWIEFVETGCTIWPQGPNTQKWYGWVREVCQRYSQDADLPHKIKIMAQEAGIRNVHEFTYDIPIGQWAGHLGSTSMANMKGFYEAMRARNIRQLNLESGEIDQTWLDLVKEWEKRHAHIRYYVVCGQK